MSETKNTKYACATMQELRQRKMLTQEEVARGLATGVIQPVMKYGVHMYCYSPEEIRNLYGDTKL